MMSSQQESFLRNLVQSSNWSVIENLAKEIVTKIRDESTIRDSEWETIKTTLQKEGKVEGIKQLLQEMYMIGTR